MFRFWFLCIHTLSAGHGRRVHWTVARTSDGLDIKHQRSQNAVLDPMAAWQATGYSQNLALRGPRGSPSRKSWRDLMKRRRVQDSGILSSEAEADTAVKGIFLDEQLAPEAEVRSFIDELVEAEMAEKVECFIDELLEVPPDGFLELPKIFSQNLHVSLHQQLIQRLEEKRDEATSPARIEQLQELADFASQFVHIYVDMHVNNSNDLKELLAAEGVANETAKEPTTVPSEPPKRRTAPIEVSAEVALQQKRDKKRGLLHAILSAAKEGEQKLDECLFDRQDEIDSDFFEYLTHEVNEAMKKEDRDYLSVLETVVQRTCLEKEAGRGDVGLLGSLLLTETKVIRQEMYEDWFPRASDSTKLDFFETLVITRMKAEQKVRKKEQVDDRILPQLRLIEEETRKYYEDTVQSISPQDKPKESED